jgi:ATP/maltotriose-dependent transcriptional regulator MalT
MRLSLKDLAGAEAVYLESAMLSRAAGDMHEYASILGTLVCGCAMERLKFAEAKQHVTEALALVRVFGDMTLYAMLQLNLAQCDFGLGDVDSALAQLKAFDAMFDSRLPRWPRAIQRTLEARIALSRRDAQGAHAVLRAFMLDECRTTKPLDSMYISYQISDTLAATMALLGQHAHAVRLRAIADKAYARNHHSRSAQIEREFAPFMAESRAALGDAGFDMAYAEGYTLSQKQAVSYLLEIGVDNVPHAVHALP